MSAVPVVPTPASPRVFLASYRLGGRGALWRELAGRRVGIIAHACDAWPAAARATTVRGEAAMLGALGQSTVEVDLRAGPAAVRRALDGLDALWVRGGNTFVLRAALSAPGLAEELRERVFCGALAWGGYSAGAVVLGPTLRGVEYADDPAEVRAVPRAGPVSWDGLGWLDAVPVVHAPGPSGPSPLDPCGAAARHAVTVRALGLRAVPLTDDDVAIVSYDDAPSGTAPAAVTSGDPSGSPSSTHRTASSGRVGASPRRLSLTAESIVRGRSHV